MQEHLFVPLLFSLKSIKWEREGGSVTAYSALERCMWVSCGMEGTVLLFAR